MKKLSKQQLITDITSEIANDPIFELFLYRHRIKWAYISLLLLVLDDVRVYGNVITSKQIKEILHYFDPIHMAISRHKDLSSTDHIFWRNISNMWFKEKYMKIPSYHHKRLKPIDKNIRPHCPQAIAYVSI